MADLFVLLVFFFAKLSLGSIVLIVSCRGFQQFCLPSQAFIVCAACVVVRFLSFYWCHADLSHKCL